jgi:hypothetical protein
MAGGAVGRVRAVFDRRRRCWRLTRREAVVDGLGATIEADPGLAACSANELARAPIATRRALRTVRPSEVPHAGAHRAVARRSLIQRVIARGGDASAARARGADGGDRTLGDRIPGQGGPSVRTRTALASVEGPALGKAGVGETGIVGTRISASIGARVGKGRPKEGQQQDENRKPEGEARRKAHADDPEQPLFPSVSARLPADTRPP